MILVLGSILFRFKGVTLAVWVPSYFLIRAAAETAGTAMGAYFTGAAPAMVRLGWSGFVAQAGVRLGFAILVEQRFAENGTVVKTATLAIVAVNQPSGPVLFRNGLFLAGEISGSGAGGDFVEES